MWIWAIVCICALAGLYDLLRRWLAIRATGVATKPSEALEGRITHLEAEFRRLESEVGRTLLAQRRL